MDFRQISSALEVRTCVADRAVP